MLAVAHDMSKIGRSDFGTHSSSKLYLTRATKLLPALRKFHQGVLLTAIGSALVPPQGPAGAFGRSRTVNVSAPYFV